MDVYKTVFGLPFGLQVVVRALSDNHKPYVAAMAGVLIKSLAQFYAICSEGLAIVAKDPRACTVDRFQKCRD